MPASSTPEHADHRAVRAATPLALSAVVSLRAGRCWAVDASGRTVEAAALARLPASALDAGLGIGLRVDASDADADDELVRVGDQVDRLGVPRGRVWVQLRDDVDDRGVLVQRTRAVRREGFLVATSEVGISPESAERILRLAPDVVRIDGALARGAALTTARRETCRAMTELARSLGAIVVADGLDDADDLVELAMLGIDLFAGPLLSPVSSDLDEVLAQAEVRLHALRGRLRARAEEELTRRRAERAVHEHVFVSAISRIAHTGVSSLDAIAEAIVRDVPGLDALYVLDHRGVQLTHTWLRPGLVPRSGFLPASPGADLGLKEYFLEVAHGGIAHVSRPYVSMASGRLSVTHSRRVRLADGATVVVCCDVPSKMRGG